jgi:hypothetical protein
VPLRIAFDLDGVFADMEGELARHARSLFGARHSAEDFPDPAHDAASAADGSSLEGGSRADRAGIGLHAGGSQSQAVEQDQSSIDEPPVRLRLSARQQRRLWDSVEAIENFWETLLEVEPGSVARLAAIAEEQHWEVIFLTRRPATAGTTSQAQSQRWLRAKGFPLPSVFVVQGSRGRIAASLALDIVVDDSPENCLDVMVDSKARAILVWRDDKPEVPAATKRLGIGVVRSVDECLNILSEIDAPGSETTSMLDRVKRLLGLKHAPG